MFLAVFSLQYEPFPLCVHLLDVGFVPVLFGAGQVALCKLSIFFFLTFFLSFFIGWKQVRVENSAWTETVKLWED